MSCAQGDVVAISPFESHLDPRLYGGPPGPDIFDPTRCAAAAPTAGAGAWGGCGSLRLRPNRGSARTPLHSVNAAHQLSVLPSPRHTMPACRDGMRLGGSTAPHAAVVGVGGLPGLSFGGGKYRRACGAGLGGCRAAALLLLPCCPCCPSIHLPVHLFNHCDVIGHHPLRCPLRCPGRYFAEAELALAAATLLLLFDFRLLPREAAAAPGAGLATAAAAAAAPGAGAAAPGDPAGLLPPPDLRKLVGIKVPRRPCWVEFQRRCA